MFLIFFLEKSPNLLNLIFRFNKVSNWVISTILQIGNIKARAEALSRFIEIAEVKKKKKNQIISLFIPGHHTTILQHLREKKKQKTKIGRN